MLIKSWRVDGYGVFNGQEGPELGRGVTVILGPNEAGKSTLLSFLRSVLFGFPERKGDKGKAEFIPAVRGGKLGGRVILEDASNGRWTVERYHGGKQLSVVSPAGAKLGEAELSDLMGHLNGESYRSVFGFDLGDLARLAALDDAGVRGRIMSAGISGAGDSAARALKKLDERLAKLLGKTGLTALAAEQKEAADRLKAARALLTAYEEKRTAQSAEEAALFAMSKELDEARAQAERFKSLLRLKPEADKLEEALAALKSLDAPDFFPEEGLARFNLHLERRRELNKRIAEIETALESERAKENEFATEPLWLAKAHALAQKDRESGEQRARLAEIEELRQECDRQSSHISAALGALGPGWTTEKLRAAPTDAIRNSLAKEYRAKIAGAENELSNARKNHAGAKARLEAAKEPAPPERGVEASWHGYAFAAGGVFALLAALALPAVGAWALYLVCAALALLGVFVALQRKTPATSPDEAARKAAFSHAKAEAERCAELEKLALSELEARLAEWVQAAQKWAISPEDLSPESAIELLAHLESAKALLTVHEATEAKLSRALAASLEWESGVLALLSETPRPAANESGEKLLDLLSGAAQKADAERAREIKERAAREAVANLSRDLELRRKEVKVEEEELAELKGAVGVSGDEEFRNAEAQYKRKLALEQDCASAKSALSAQWGLGWAESAEWAELISGSPEEWRAKLDATIAGGKALSEQYTARNRDFGAAAAALKEVEQSSAVAEIEASVETIKAQGATTARDWRVTAAARELIVRSLAKYARERQPGVLAEGSRLFAEMTGGRFTRVLQAPDGEGILAERANGELLEVTALSRGTREELYLCVRLGLAADFSSRGANLPLIADDVFVNFDPARALSAIGALTAFAAGRQVIVFTCHPETVARFRAVSPEVKVFALDPATGALESA